ncbi:hypothetical protein NOF04DRAFT_14076 [Fusarium oxysporum II5]|uniref:Uncharacterized protein n=2 Tax=Fusarium oxysporum species complex TaxID=171631 RepID=X0K7J6_FUSO5|nr:uncharacterized protein FOIG_13884 [Fusarium odoratissimum NRRL 54006]EXL92994.1 hypothetical protein FOIG_13884 [Fusarium odoratissimum NRRL 54006]KAK2134321.1 hypothetical protein NOF04DRAFT_14076 [Fusarium oxysporum II5]TXC12104.1 hypothetical protein FocTR4_00007580 [Fusarium oxysporum f. sp. cubense]
MFWSHAFHEVVNYTIAQRIKNYYDIVNAAPERDTAVELGMAFDGFDKGPVDQEKIKSIVNLTDCMFAHRTEMQMLAPSGQSLDPNQEYLFQDYRNFARRSVEKYFKVSEDEKEEYEDDDDEFLSLPKAICLLHDFLLVARTPGSSAETTTSDQIAALIPEMREKTQN